MQTAPSSSRDATACGGASIAKSMKARWNGPVSGSAESASARPVSWLGLVLVLIAWVAAAWLVWQIGRAIYD